MIMVINKLCKLIKLSCPSPAPRFQPIWQKWRKQEMLSSFKPRAMKHKRCLLQDGEILGNASIPDSVSPLFKQKFS